MIEEILRLGFDRVELGYDLTLDLVPGVQKMVEQKVVFVDSVHAFCPVPVGAPYGHPELFSLISPDSRVRACAVSHIVKTANFAAEMGAKAVVSHAGNIRMKNMTERLIRLCENGRQFMPEYEKMKTKLMMRRDRKARKHLDYLYKGIEQLLPAMEKAGVCLALENLPSWESVPSEPEAEDLIVHFNSPFLRYWHDIGHGQIRQNLGFVAQIRWLERLEPYLVGMHVHDVAKPACDHIMPPLGDIDFGVFRRFAKRDVFAVLEPKPGTPADEIAKGIQVLSAQWKEEGNEPSLPGGVMSARDFGRDEHRTSNIARPMSK